MSTFGERLSKLRTEKKMSQAELSARLNIAKSTLAMYETDKREPSFETLERIADFFGVKTDYLITGNIEDSSPSEKKVKKDELTNVFFSEWDQADEEKRKRTLDFIRFLKQQDSNKDN